MACTSSQTASSRWQKSSSSRSRRLPVWGAKRHLLPKAIRDHALQPKEFSVTDGALMAEMTTQVFFVAHQAQNVLTAPVAALQGSTTANLQTAQVIAANGKIETREVRTGISDRLKVQILEGLNEGDHLVIGPATGSGG